MTTTANTNDIKAMVRSKYAEIAETEPSAADAPPTKPCCCSCNTKQNLGVSKIMADEYVQVQGYHPDADLGLGCGLPTQYAHIQPGDHVLDLGSGAGNDCFVARAVTGPTGKVVGVDFTPSMIARAQTNAQRRGYTNVEFVQGDIETLPLANTSFDVVVSNCVLNLVPHKATVFAEMFRVLKAGGHFSISDIVLEGALPDHIRSVAELYAGCISGAMQLQDYVGMIPQAGFVKVQIQKKKPIVVPDELLLEHLTPEQVQGFKDSGTGIFSITVYAEKPVGC